ncbi:phosphoribosylglycinamide formyltransferase 2 [Yersinia pestis PY-89]|nr:phosphoribosylglycinamide formyltransferase 2 [Yersinia pestis PY-89]
MGTIRQYGAAASAVILPELTSQNITYRGLETALIGDTQIRLFGKPEIAGKRRLGVALAVADNIETAIEVAKKAAGNIEVSGE